MKRKILAILLALTIAAAPVLLADTPFQGYSYNYWGFLVPAPAAYIPARAFSLADIDPSLGVMSEPTDLHVCSQYRIHLVDSGNDRIIVFDRDLNLLRLVDGFYRPDGSWDTFSRPHGVFVTDAGHLYVADNQNRRVVSICEDYQMLREIQDPHVEGRTEDFLFLPLHVLVNRGGSLFVIAQHEFEGIMMFNQAGYFLGYFGTIEVSFNPIQLFWRFFMTDAQLERQNRFIPRQFLSMDMDQYGFIFTTHVETWHLNNQVMRLNPRGEDVLANFNDNVVINGDQGWRDIGHLSGPSIFVDVVARSHGMYSALCSVRGRIYTYDEEGNLLYVFGGTGTLLGMTQRPVSIEMLGCDILLLDAHGGGRVIHYIPTEYGNLVNSAIRLRYDGFERQAVEYWRRLVQLDENFALAWSGIGRAMMAYGDNYLAMQYLRQGMDVRYFSLAFRRHRMETMQETLPNIFTGGAVLIALVAGVKIVKRIRKGGGEDDAN